MKKVITVLSLMLLFLFIGLYCANHVQLNEAYIEKVVNSAQKKFSIPAVAVNLMDSNQILYSVYDGVRVTGSSERITSDDYFHIGSCSKMILVYIAANLVEENTIDWATKFFDLYPDLKKDAREDYYDITLEDLLSWTAGIQAYTSGEEAYPELPESENQLLAFSKYLLRLEPSANRTNSGKFEYLYSNASYSIACAMLEKASGLSYEELLAKYISKQLGLDVIIGWPYQFDQNQPYGHFQVDNNTLEVIGPDVEYALNPLITAAGNLSMKSEDFAKFVQSYLQIMLGKNTNVSSKSIQNIHAEIMDFHTLYGQSYSYFDGSAGTFYARVLVIPETDFALTILINSGSAEAVEYISNQLLRAKYKAWWSFWE